MKRALIPLVVVLLVTAFVFTGLTAPSSQTTSAQTPTVTVSPTPSTPAPSPVSGGTLRVIAPAGPQVLSYVPDMGPNDAGAVFPAVERLMDATKDRSMGNGLEPVLAQSVDDDVANKRIVFHLRPNVKFHDGSVLNADVVIWNFQLLIDAKRLQFQNYFSGIKKLDDMTVEVDYTTYTNQLIHSWGWMAMYSKAAWDKASGGDLAKGKEWAKSNCVGTGPFKLAEFKRDDHMYFVKNPDYWRPGQPYLDRIEYRYIPDSVTAQNIFMAGQADEWDGAPLKMQQDLVSQGYIRSSSWPALPNHIWPNTSNPNSKWNDLRLRQAIEYALDKPAIAKALGGSLAIPMTMVAPPGEWGYDPNYPARNYDPAKAKQLLADAGYPNGLNAKLLVINTPEAQDAGTAIKQYLDAVGMTIDLDVADPGRFYGSVWGNTIPTGDLSYMWSGMDVTQLVTYMRWFSSDPFTNLAYLGRPPEQVALDNEAKAIPDVAGQKAITEKIIKWMTDNTRIIPLFEAPAAVMVQKYVHTDRMSQGFIRWQAENTWMDKH